MARSLTEESKESQTYVENCELPGQHDNERLLRVLPQWLQGAVLVRHVRSLNEVYNILLLRYCSVYRTQT
jgi:hypothetical protein